MSASVADAPRSPGRPRSVRADEAIIEATLDLLAEGMSVDVLSIEAIAARAGVGKATIYRRWTGKDALLHDALATSKAPAPLPAGESVRDDLVLLLVPVGPQPDPRFAADHAVHRAARDAQPGALQGLPGHHRAAPQRDARRCCGAASTAASCGPTSTSR